MSSSTCGDAYNQTYCYIFRVKDGQITEVVEHCDTALVERVLEQVRRSRSSDGHTPGL